MMISASVASAVTIMVPSFEYKQVEYIPPPNSDECEEAEVLVWTGQWALGNNVSDEKKTKKKEKIY
jgi:hypothetical protein